MMSIEQRNRDLSEFMECKEYTTFLAYYALLMEVVEKIESLGYSVCIVKESCVIQTEYLQPIITCDRFPTKKEIIFTAVSGFANWYKQKLISENKTDPAPMFIQCDICFGLGVIERDLPFADSFCGNCHGAGSVKNPNRK